MQRGPGFSALKDGLSTYELLPPTGPEIAQIIREPARVAGLRFEESAGQGRLDDVLQAAAAADPGSLPLLEFVLDALYEAGRDRRLLTFAAYRALGGLEGAIAGAPTKSSTHSLPASKTRCRRAAGAYHGAARRRGITARPASLADIAEQAGESALVECIDRGPASGQRRGRGRPGGDPRGT